MSCAFCASGDQKEFPAEVIIHLPGLENVDKPLVMVFPKILVCLKCGSSSFTTPPPELEQLA